MLIGWPVRTPSRDRGNRDRRIAPAHRLKHNRKQACPRPICRQPVPGDSHIRLAGIVQNILRRLHRRAWGQSPLRQVARNDVIDPQDAGIVSQLRRGGSMFVDVVSGQSHRNASIELRLRGRREESDTGRPRSWSWRRRRGWRCRLEHCCRSSGRWSSGRRSRQVEARPGRSGSRRTRPYRCRQQRCCSAFLRPAQRLAGSIAHLDLRRVARGHGFEIRFRDVRPAHDVRNQRDHQFVPVVLKILASEQPAQHGNIGEPGDAGRRSWYPSAE